VYQNYNTCMAGNIQLIFYKSRKPGDEILVKALLCGREATLPLPGDRLSLLQMERFPEVLPESLRQCQNSGK
jgi:hypothetical protein